jgi:hypothetical protein
MGTPLFDKNANQVVDMDPAQVPAALKSGQFTFVKGRNVPIIQDGTPIWVKPEDAAKKRSQLLYTSDEEVERSQAEQKTAGLGGAAKALAYGGFKSATLGLGPLVAGAVSPEARETFRELELGRPGLTTLGELGGLAFDPFAAAAKLGQRGAAKGAAAAAERAAAQRASVSPALKLGEAATEAAAVPPAQTARSAAEQTAGLGAQRAAIGPQVTPSLGGAQALAPTAEEAAQLAAEAEARRLALGRSAVARGRAIAEEETPSFGPLMERMPPEPGFRLGTDPYQTPELAMRGRQAEELTRRAAAARGAETRMAEEAAGMERGLQPGQVGPVEDFAQMPGSAMERDYLQSELSRIDDALEANAAAARRARSSASRDRIGAEREQLLAERERLDVANMRTGMRAEEDLATQAERAYEATQMQAAAPGRAAEAQRAGRMAADIEAANTLPPTLRTAGTDFGGVSPASPFGERIAGLPLGRAAEGVGALETPGLVSAAGARTMAPMGKLAETTIPEAGFKLGKAGRAALEQGIYGAASQAQRQQLGLEEGGAKEIAEAGLLGAGIGAGLTLGGQKLAKGAKALTEVASQSAGPDLGSKIGQAAARAEESYLLRMFGLDKKTIKELNVRMVDAGAGKRGTSEFADFARNGIANLEALKAEFPENQFLQSIDFSRGPLRFGKLNPEQRTAFAEALMNSTGKSIEDVYSQAAGQTVNSANLADAIMRVRSSLQSKGLGDLPMETIRGELKAFEDSLRRGEQYTVGSLREYEKNLSARFREARGKEPFTEAQKLFRDEVKKAYLDAAKEVIPDIEARLAVPNREYSIAERMFKGAQDVEARLAGTSPVGRDSLAQFALGVVAVLNPVGAVSFLVATTALRGIYNQRGEGILADLAGKLAGKGISVVKAPQQAAQEAVSSVINARRPLLMGYNAERLVEASPADYTELAKSVRELQATRGEMQGRLEQAVSRLPPAEQQKALADFDQVVNTLESNLPKGLSTEKALSEQEKRYMVFARSVLDQVYGTQVVSNGGQYAEEAARAFQSVPGGKEYLDKFAEDLRTRINENEKLRGNEQLMQVYRNVKRASGVKGLSGGRKGAIMFSSSAMFGQGGGEGGGGGLGAAPKVGASARQQAGQSLAGVFKTQ